MTVVAADLLAVVDRLPEHRRARSPDDGRQGFDVYGRLAHVGRTENRRIQGALPSVGWRCVSTFGGPWRLVVADLDGTLVTATTACVYLDGWIGHGPVIEGLERRCAGGEITDTQVAESYAPFYRDIAVADASAVMAQISSLDDIALGVSLLSGRGIDAVIATVSWSSSPRR